MRRVLPELQLMDADVKRKQARTRGLLALPPTPRPLALPFGPGEVLDLTYSPPAQAFPAPSPFTFPALGPGPGGQLLGAITLSFISISMATYLVLFSSLVYQSIKY